MGAAQAKPVHNTTASEGSEGANHKPLGAGFLRCIERACHVWCVAGGIVLVVAVAVILASILGRFAAGLGIGPGAIVGDNELMEAACVIAAFAFLPWCQIKRGHVAVDILVSHLGRRAGLFAGVISDIGMLAVSVLIAWRLFVNLLEKHLYGETTMLLYMPTSWIYALSFVGCILFALACVVTLTDHINALTARPAHKNITRSN